MKESLNSQHSSESLHTNHVSDAVCSSDVQDALQDTSSPNTLWHRIHDKWIKPVIRLDDTPESIALGAAIGMFIAITPTVGIQMTVVVMLGTFINACTRYQMNNVVGIAMCWISNPVTFIPMYYLHTWLGWLLMGRDTSTLLSIASWQEKINSYVPPVTNPTTWDTIKGYFLAGVGDLLLPMWLGAVIIATLLAIPTYPITLRMVRTFQQRRKRKA